MTTNSGLRTIQRDAWAFGRSVRGSLLEKYEQEYGALAPPPALIGPELLTDFMDVALAYDALDLNVYAETTWQDGRALVTVNSRTREIEGVKDAQGVMNVGVWHELIHVERDLSEVRVGSQAAFEGMLPNLTIACRRDRQRAERRSEEFRREFFAEEAGRAAAVSFPHLIKTDDFRQFVYLAEQRLASGANGWRCLYAAAEAIGVNISALLKQLEAEGYLAVERGAGRSTLHPQPGLGDLLRRTTR